MPYLNEYLKLKMSLRIRAHFIVNISSMFDHNTIRYFSDFKEIKNPTLPALKRGTGGRCSFNGSVVTIFGATGFVGRYLCNRLGKIGAQMIIPFRGCESDTKHLKVSGDLGQVLFTPYDLRDKTSIKKAMYYSNVVVNLVGRDWETKNFNFKKVHVDGAQRIAKIAKKAGIETFVHVSALNLKQQDPFLLPSGSKFLISKQKGEEAVLKEFPQAIIFRPADIYGQEDRFFRYICSSLRHSFGKGYPMYAKGEKTIKQPVYVGDVAQGIVEAIKKSKKFEGKIIQAVGPRRYCYADFLDWTHKVMRKDTEWGYRRYDIKFDPLFQLLVTVLPKLTFGWPMGNLHWERLERECITDTVEEEHLTLKDLGVTLTSLEDRIHWELRRNMAWQYYAAEVGTWPEVTPPQPVKD